MTTLDNQSCVQLRIFTGDPIRAEQAAQRERLQCGRPSILALWPEIERPNTGSVALASPTCDADVLYVAEWAITEARTNSVVIVATRSELFLLRVRRRAVEKVIDPSLVQIMYCEDDKSAPREISMHDSVGILGLQAMQERMAIDTAREYTEDELMQPF